MDSIAITPAPPQPPLPQPTRASERIWAVELWVQDPETGEWLHDAIAEREAYIEAQAIQRRAGGVMSIAAERVANFPAPGVTVTRRLVFRWQSFVPLVDAEEEQPQEEPGEAPAAADSPEQEVRDEIEAEVEEAEQREKAAAGNGNGRSKGSKGGKG